MKKKHSLVVIGETNDSPSNEGGENSLADFAQDTVDRLRELGVEISDFEFNKTTNRFSFYFEAEDTPEQ